MGDEHCRHCDPNLCGWPPGWHESKDGRETWAGGHCPACGKSNRAYPEPPPPLPVETEDLGKGGNVAHGAVFAVVALVALVLMLGSAAFCLVLVEGAKQRASAVLMDGHCRHCDGCDAGVAVGWTP